MTIFAGIVLDPGSIVAWLVVGLIAGWLAGKVMQEASYGMWGDVLLGCAGGLVGGLVYGLFTTGVPGFWGATLVAFIGACLVVGGARAIVAVRGA
jgi:uncharacterized membrane protein YeaQ/YmgE (transglycosylase-associated protein family)